MPLLKRHSQFLGMSLLESVLSRLQESSCIEEIQRSGTSVSPFWFPVKHGISKHLKSSPTN